MASPLTSHSLLERARDPADAGAWRRLTELYIPLVRRWLRPYTLQAADAEDLVQEILATLVRELPRFEDRGRPGAFRCWLRRITVNRLRAYWQVRQARSITAQDQGFLDQLEDPQSVLSRSWDEEHDRYVAKAILDSIRLEFTTPTWLAFESTAREGRPAAEVAAELGITVNAVLIAKSRVLRRLRQQTRGLID